MKQAVEDICEKVNNSIYKRDPYSFQVIIMVQGRKIVETFYKPCSQSLLER